MAWVRTPNPISQRDNGGRPCESVPYKKFSQSPKQTSAMGGWKDRQTRFGGSNFEPFAHAAVTAILNPVEFSIEGSTVSQDLCVQDAGKLDNNHSMESMAEQDVEDIPSCQIDCEMER